MLFFIFKKIRADAYRKLQRLLYLSGFRFCIALFIQVFIADFPLPKVEPVSPQSQQKLGEQIS